MKVSETTKSLLTSVQKKLGLKNIHQTPRIEKVIVAIWIGSLATRKGMKDFSELEKNLQKITGQKPCMILSKKSISNFKLREDMPSMLKVTLREQKAYDFLKKLTKIVLPRVRDFNGLLVKSFDSNGWYSLGLKTYNIFPELHPDDITTDTGIQISIESSSKNKDEVKALLETLGFIFQ